MAEEKKENPNALDKKELKKWLHQFVITRTIDEDVTETSEDEHGKEVKVTKKVPTKVETLFRLKKPNRRMYDEAELFYGVKMAEGIKAGLLTRTLLAKRYENDGGALSEAEKERYSDLYMEIYNKENEYQKLMINADNKSESLKDRLAGELLSEIAEFRRELQELENNQSQIFENTAENRARNQVIMWWVLNLSHWKEYDHKTDYEEFFGKGNYDERLEAYDDRESEDDDFFNEAIRRLAYFVSFWYMGRAATQDDFIAVESIYETQNVEEGVVEEEVAEEVAEEVVEEKKTPKKKATKKKKVTKAAKDEAEKPKVESEAPKETEKELVENAS